MTVEKRKKLLQVHELYGENLSGPDGPLYRWRKIFAERLEKRHRELETWLRDRGMLKNKEEKR